MPIARNGVRRLIVILLAAMLPLGAAVAKLGGGGPVAVARGGWAWNEAGTSGDVHIHIDRAGQRAYVYRGGELIGVSAASTGKKGHRTPLGDFTILEKAVYHRSNKYSNAPMPFMQRLTWGGVALHAGYLPGYPASHGCIRLPRAFARKLFAATALGAFVRVTDGGPSLPRVELVSAKPPPALTTPRVEIVMAAPARKVVLAAAEPRHPPTASWQEQSADDYVTWGSVLPGRARTATE